MKSTCPNCAHDIEWHTEPMPFLRTHLGGLTAMQIENGFCETTCIVYLHSRLKGSGERATMPVMLPGGCCWWQKPEAA